MADKPTNDLLAPGFFMQPTTASMVQTDFDFTQCHFVGEIISGIPPVSIMITRIDIRTCEGLVSTANQSNGAVATTFDVSYQVCYVKETALFVYKRSRFLQCGVGRLYSKWTITIYGQTQLNP